MERSQLPCSEIQVDASQATVVRYQNYTADAPFCVIEESCTLNLLQGEAEQWCRSRGARLCYPNELKDSTSPLAYPTGNDYFVTANKDDTCLGLQGPHYELNKEQCDEAAAVVGDGQVPLLISSTSGTNAWPKGCFVHAATQQIYWNPYGTGAVFNKDGNRMCGRGEASLSAQSGVVGCGRNDEQGRVWSGEPCSKLGSYFTVAAATRFTNRVPVCKSVELKKRMPAMCCADDYGEWPNGQQLDVTSKRQRALRALRALRATLPPSPPPSCR